MLQYLNLLNDIVRNGHDHVDRTGVGRRSVFGREMRFDLTGGSFPLVTTRKVFVRGLIEEMLWFLTGSHNTLELEAKGVNIWKAWTPTLEDAEALIEKLQQQPNSPFTDDAVNNDRLKTLIRRRVGTIGPMYGAIWRGNYDAGNGKPGPDQIAALVHGLKTKPYGSRHTVTAQIPALLPNEFFTPKENVLIGRGALAPCHCFFQCFVTPGVGADDAPRLSLKVEIRSNDIPVGNPYNTAQYALLLMMLAHCVDMEAHELIVSIGDAHVYLDQLDLVREQLTRKPFPLPHLAIVTDNKDIGGFTLEDFDFCHSYLAHPVIQYPVAY